MMSLRLILGLSQVHIVMTYLEIYNDTLKDLISNSTEDLTVRQVDSVFKVIGLREERAFTGGVQKPAAWNAAMSFMVCSAPVVASGGEGLRFLGWKVELSGW